MGSVTESTNAGAQGKLIINAIEEKAIWTPNDTYMRYPGEDWETKGFRSMSWYNYASAINKVAYWLNDHLGKATNNDTIAYFGPNDPRYAILVPAAIKTGRKVRRKTSYASAKKG